MIKIIIVGRCRKCLYALHICEWSVIVSYPWSTVDQLFLSMLEKPLMLEWKNSDFVYWYQSRLHSIKFYAVFAG